MRRQRLDIVSRPMNVQVKRGSYAERHYRSGAGLPGGAFRAPKAIAPGITPAPLHDLLFHGGNTIPEMQYRDFFVGETQAWSEETIASIDRALAAAMSDRRCENVIAQYFPGRKISCTFLGSEVLGGSTPRVVSQGDVQALLRRLHAQGRLGQADLGTTLFNFLLPSGTVLNTDPEPTGSLAPPASGSARARPRARPASPEQRAGSLSGLGGYHGSIHVKRAGRDVTLYYSVGVFSEVLSNGKENGIVVFDEPWKNVVATFYHELSEFRTDPDVEDAIRAGADPAGAGFLGWTSRQGEEVGDFPIFAANPLTEVFREVRLTGRTTTLVPIQFQYSNAVHGPEGPIEQPHA